VVWLDASAAGKFRRAVERLTCRRGNCSSSLKSSLSLSLSLAAFFLSFSLLPKSVSSSFCLVYSSTHIVSFCCCCSRSLFRSLEGTTSQLWNLLSLQSCSRSPPNLSLSPSPRLAVPRDNIIATSLYLGVLVVRFRICPASSLRQA
jgi:hypothetical protein